MWRSEMRLYKMGKLLSDELPHCLPKALNESPVRRGGAICSDRQSHEGNEAVTPAQESE
jgi:hypothetical protein